MIYNATFLKRAAISTDWENIRNNSVYHPRAWFNKLQNYFNNNLFAANEQDNFLKSMGKGLGRFVLGDLISGTLKNAIGLADVPIRMGLSGIDALKGNISGKEFLGRGLDSVNDAIWTGLSLATGGTAAGVGKAAIRGAKSILPGTVENMLKRHLAKSSAMFNKSWEAAAKAGDKKALTKLLNDRAKTIGTFARHKGLSKSQIDMYKASLLKDLKVKPDNMGYRNREAFKSDIFKDYIKSQNLLNSKNSEAVYTAIRNSNNGLKDAYNMYKNTGLSKANKLSGNIRNAMWSPWVTYPAGISIVPALGEATGIMDPEGMPSKILNAPFDIFQSTISGAGNLANNLITHVPKDYVDNTLQNLGLPEQWKEMLFSPGKGNQYILNTKALQQLAKAMAEAQDIPEDEAYRMLYANIMPRNTMTAEPWLGTSRAFQQILGGATNSTVSNENKARFIEALTNS